MSPFGKEALVVDEPGPFETHLTLALDPAQPIDPLRAFAEQASLKFTHILLDNGQNPSQPMLTRHAPGPLSRELAEVANLTRALADRKLDVIRVKIEIAADNPCVPQGIDQARAGARGRYFEHHVKLLLGQRTEMTALQELARRHDARLSRNALRTRDDGQQERFLTQRRYQVDRQTARLHLDALLNELTQRNYQIIDIEEEYVIYDSNQSIDAGWMDH
jgi:hypothetical protein